MASRRSRHHQSVRTHVEVDEDLLTRTSWVNAEVAYKQLQKGKIEGNKYALWERMHIQNLLFSVGCFIQLHAEKVLLVGLLLLCLCCVGLKTVRIETSVDKLWVEEGGRLEKELEYTQKMQGEGSGSTHEILIQTPKVGNILSQESMLTHLRALVKASNIEINYIDKKTKSSSSWSFRDICYRASFPIYDTDYHLIHNIIQDMLPCIVITPLDCFWEGAKVLGPTHGIQTSYLSFLDDKALKWTNLNPADMIKRFGGLTWLEDIFKRAGITTGYQEKPCLNATDEDCPELAPNKHTKQFPNVGAELTGGCSGFAEKFMHWEEELIVGGVTKNKTGHIVKAEALQSIIQIMGEKEVFDYYHDRTRIHGMEWSIDVAREIIHAWQRAYNKEMEQLSRSNTSSEFSPFSMTSLTDVMISFSSLSPLRVSLGYVLMVIYACVSLLRWNNSINSQCTVGVLGVFLVALSVAAGLGMCSLLGVRFNASTTQIIPFLALGLGVDDMFLMVHTYGENFDNDNILLSERTGHCLRRVGVSVLITSLANMLAFFSAAIIPIPALRAFSLQAGILVLFNMGTVLLIFPAIVSVDLRRREARRMDFLCCLHGVDNRVMHLQPRFTPTDHTTVTQEQYSPCPPPCYSPPPAYTETPSPLHNSRSNNAYMECPVLQNSNHHHTSYPECTTANHCQNSHTYTERPSVPSSTHSHNDNQLCITNNTRNLYTNHAHCNNQHTSHNSNNHRYTNHPHHNQYTNHPHNTQNTNHRNNQYTNHPHNTNANNHILRRDLITHTTPGGPIVSSLGQHGSSLFIRPDSTSPVYESQSSLRPNNSSCSTKVKNECLRWNFSYLVSSYYAPLLHKTFVKVLVFVSFGILLCVGIWGTVKVKDGLELTDIVPRDTTMYRFLERQQKYFSFYQVFAVTKGDFDYPNNQALFREYHHAFEKVDKIMKREGGSLPMFWLDIFRQWLVDLQKAFDMDEKNGSYHDTGWHKNTTVDGILAYKLLAQTGNVDDPIGRSQVRTTRLVNSEGIINPAAFYNYLTAWTSVDALGYESSMATFHPMPLTWSHDFSDPDYQDHSLRIPKSPPLKYAQISFIIYDLAHMDAMIDTVTEMRSICDDFTNRGLPNYPRGVPFTFWEQYLTLRLYLVASLLLILMVTFLVIALVLMNVWVALIVVGVLASITIELFGFMGLMDIKLSAIPAVILIISVGIGVEFTVHICMGFMTSIGSRDHRMWMSLRHTVSPVIHGAVSTFLGIIMLVGAEFDFIVKYFFNVLAVLMALGILNGLLFLPVLLSVVGPQAEVRPKNGGHRISPPTPEPPPRKHGAVPEISLSTITEEPTQFSSHEVVLEPEVVVETSNHDCHQTNEPTSNSHVTTRVTATATVKVAVHTQLPGYVPDSCHGNHTSSCSSSQGSGGPTQCRQGCDEEHTYKSKRRKPRLNITSSTHDSSHA